MPSREQADLAALDTGADEARRRGRLADFAVEATRREIKERHLAVRALEDLLASLLSELQPVVHQVGLVNGRQAGAVKDLELLRLEVTSVRRKLRQERASLKAAIERNTAAIDALREEQDQRHGEVMRALQIAAKDGQVKSADLAEAHRRFSKQTTILTIAAIVANLAAANVWRFFNANGRISPVGAGAPVPSARATPGAGAGGAGASQAHP